jgi:probable rRNA maturation factor
MSLGAATVLFRSLPFTVELTAEEKRLITSFARTLSARVANGRPFTCVISDDSELRRLNHAFRGRDYSTDILSFPSQQSVGDMGDMIISMERAEQQASEFGHGRTDEIRILMLHGLLHLAGMDHERDRGQMAGAERKWRQQLGLPVTVIARATRQG